ncbi:MAG: B12-binding domain-containing radical SAM protein [Nitrospirae bacterium YQR-1]
MKITLISPYPDITVFGLRTISACLKEKGYETHIVFLPDPYGDNIIHGKDRYEQYVMDELVEICKDSDFIGVTLMTNFFDGAVQITRSLKKSLKVPVIWGGVHPTIRPEESLEFADYVCVGEGEDAVVEFAEKLASGKDPAETPGLWCLRNGTVIKNPVGVLDKNLDKYPRPDYSFTDHYVLFNGRIRPLTNELTKEFLEKGTVSAYLKKIGYQTMTGRGCPHKCTYCINDTIKTLYSGKGYLRWRSTPHVIDELLWVKENMPYIGYIWISDDSFFGRGIKNIGEFCKSYKEQIGLPFTCLASPLTITEEKMELLVDAGLMYIQMGIESGSAKIQEVFNRKAMSNDRMMAAIKIINKYKDRMSPPSYDFILDVPYETDEDKIESLEFVSRIPKPFHLQPFSLVLYPETKLYQKAKEDGYITDEKRDIYSKTYTMRDPNYFNLLISLSKDGKLPGPVLRFLIKPKIVKMMMADKSKPIVKNVYHILQRAKQIVRHLGERT